MEEEELLRVASKCHVFVFPWPIQGHINPMLQLSKRLASKGLKVTLIATTSISTTIPQISSINIETIFDGYNNKQERPSDHNIIIKKFKATVPKTLAELIQKHASSPNPVKCVIYDSVMPWILNIARSFGIYGTSFFTQSCGVAGLYYHKIQGALKVPVDEKVIISLPWYPEMDVNDLPSFIVEEGPYKEITDLAFCQLSNVHEVDWILWNTFKELEDQALTWMGSKWSIMTVGPTIPSMFLDKRLEDDKDYGLSLFKPNSDTCMNWLNSKEPNSVIYVSFGSLAALGEDQMTELAWGLKRSNTNFLWVVRESGEKKLPPKCVEETTEKGLVINWSPQLEVLSHKSVGCFITHCGWNSTLEALSLGVPMVAMPQWTDQPTNAKFVTDVWRVGVRVQVDGNGIVTRGEIERCVKEVMEGESGKEMRRNSEKWKELAKLAVDEGGSSDKNIEEFVSKLVGNSENSSYY